MLAKRQSLLPPAGHMVELCHRPDFINQRALKHICFQPSGVQTLGQTLPGGDIGQCIETFSAVTTGDECY